MLNLVKKRRLGSDAIPAGLTILSVSWMNGQFKAVAVQHGVVTGTWESPTTVNDATAFEKLIREAVRQTGYQGQTVSLLLAHPQMAQHLLEVPPAKGAVLLKLIQRQTQQLKLFPGEAVGTYQMLPSGKGTQRVLLHLFPNSLLNQYLQGCKNNGLHLTACLPASVVLYRQLGQLPLEKDDTALLAAEIASSTVVVVGRSDGSILLARTLPGSWNEAEQRIALDLNRTVLYINQQFGASLKQSVWIFGIGAAHHWQALQSQIQFPVKPSPVEPDSFYWAREAVKLHPEFCPNFISAELQKAPQRRAFAKVVVGATTLFVAAALATAGYAHWQAYQARQAIQKASADVARLQNRQQELQRLDEELTAKEQVVKLVVSNCPPPAPAWLLAYLSDAVPSGLIVTNLQITRDQDLWRIKLSGTSVAASDMSAAQRLADPIQTLKSRLSGPPFYIRFAEPPPKPLAAKEDRGGWLNRVTGKLSEGAPAPAQAVAQDYFIMEGLMR